MALLRSFILPFLLIFAAPLQAATGDSGWFYRGSDVPPDPAWQFGTLSNGVRYAVRRNPLPARQISIRLRIDAGSLNEADGERGWAHLVEHLVFRGGRHFGDREARHTWQQLGASFGSDTNASTDTTDTVYQLDLPDAERAGLDQSLAILADMADGALFEPATVDAERKIVLAEKRRRPEIATRYDEATRPLFYAGLKYEKRDPIGTEETLAAATPEALRAFYERWYRPDRATVVIVGDADPAMMIELIAKRFGDWKPSGPAPAAPDYGAIAEVAEPVATLAYPGAPITLSGSWIRPFDDRPDTIAKEADDLADRLAAQIVNRRLENRARLDNAPYISSAVGVGDKRHIADMTQLSISAKEGRWRDALTESFAVIADALRAPPSKTEIAREMSNLHTALAAAVAGETSVLSQQRAQQLVAAIDQGEVVTTAADLLALIDRLAPQMTPERIQRATERLFSGAGPRLALLTPEPLEGGAPVLRAALATAQKAAPVTRASERTVDFNALPPLGQPGRETSRQTIADLGVTIVRFANGASLTFKQTDFEKGSVGVQLRFGNGIAGLPADRASLAWTSSVVARAGLADLDLDAMERLMTGRRINIDFGVDEDAYVLTGSTRAEELGDQLRFLATKLAYPRWDPPLFNRFQQGWLESYELNFASASARAGREMGAVTHPGDARWAPVDKDAIKAASPDAFARFFAPVLATGPVQAIIVGDVDLEAAVKAAAATIGALPTRPQPGTMQTKVQPPRPDPAPRRFTHQGDPNQAFAMIGWSTFGGTDRIKDRRALSLAANVLKLRLFDRLREEEGATYSPGATATSSETFDDWGIFAATAEVKPENVDDFFRIGREEVARLAAAPVPAGEFAESKNPIVSGIERRLKTNGYWLSTMEDWITKPELIDQTRSYLADYRALTPEDVQRAVKSFVADEGDWSMLVLPAKAASGGH